MKRINLIPEARRLARQRRLRYRAWLVVGGVYTGILVVVCLSIFGMKFGVDIRAITDELAQVEGELSEIEATREAIRPELAERRLILSSSRSIADQPDWSVMLHYLANDLLDDEIVLRSCSLAPVGGPVGAGELVNTPLTLTLTGFAKSTPAASQFVLRMEQSGLFDRVTLTRTNMEPFLNGQAIVFEVRCQVDEEKGGG